MSAGLRRRLIKTSALSLRRYRNHEDVCEINAGGDRAVEVVHEGLHRRLVVRPVGRLDDGRTLVGVVVDERAVDEAYVVGHILKQREGKEGCVRCAWAGRARVRKKHPTHLSVPLARGVPSLFPFPSIGSKSGHSHRNKIGPLVSYVSAKVDGTCAVLSVRKLVEVVEWTIWLENLKTKLSELLSNFEDLDLEDAQLAIKREVYEEVYEGNTKIRWRILMLIETSSKIRAFRIPENSSSVDLAKEIEAAYMVHNGTMFVPRSHTSRS